VRDEVALTITVKVYMIQVCELESGRSKVDTLEHVPHRSHKVCTILTTLHVPIIMITLNEHDVLKVLREDLHQFTSLTNLLLNASTLLLRHVLGEAVPVEEVSSDEEIIEAALLGIVEELVDEPRVVQGNVPVSGHCPVPS